MKRLLYTCLAIILFSSPIHLLWAADIAEKTNQLVSHIHEANLKEVDLGRLAVQKAQNSSVKEYGRQMISGHQDADQKLLQLVAKESLTLEPQNTGKPDSKREKLTQESGFDFDKAYIDCMIDGHNKLLQEIKSAPVWLPKDSAVTLLVQDLIPVVDHHLMMAKQIQTELKEVRK